MPITVLNVGYRSTNFWVVSAGSTRLLVDLGWPGMFGALAANLKRMGVPMKELRYGLATHYHIDHAGAAQDLKNQGMRLIVTEEQVSAIPKMKQWTKPQDNYTEIATFDNLLVKTSESRAFLKGLGIAGEIVHTPGHSDDSVTLVLDNGMAFIGDLTSESMVAEEDPNVVKSSWQKLRDLGATTIYAGHGPIRPMPSLQGALAE